MNTSPQRRADGPTSDTATSCDTCNDLLDVYLDAELSNVNVEHCYPEIWQHIQTCSQCSTYYDWLRAMLRKNPASRPHLRPFRGEFDISFLPFHQSPSAEDAPPSPWLVYLRPRLFGEPFLLHFSFLPEYLRHQAPLIQAALADFTSDSASDSTSDFTADFTALGESAPPSHRLLREELHLPDQEITVEIRAYPLTAQPGWMQLQASLVIFPESPLKLQARIRWAAIERSITLPEFGAVRLGEVPLAAVQPDSLSEKDVFSVTFNWVS